MSSWSLQRIACQGSREVGLPASGAPYLPLSESVCAIVSIMAKEHEIEQQGIVLDRCCELKADKTTIHQVAEQCSVQHETDFDAASNMATDFTTNIIDKDSISWKEWRGDLITRVLHSDAMHRPHATHNGNWIQSVTALIALGMTMVDVDDIY